MSKLRAAIITDIHYGTDRGATLGLKASKYVTHFIRAANGMKLDAVFDVGDRITATNQDNDKTQMKKICSLFNQLAAPVHNLIGNHDITNLSANDNQALTGSPAHHYSVDLKGFHILCWNPIDHDGKRGILKVNDKDIAWLKQDLAQTDKPTIVFSHVPLDSGREEYKDNGKKVFADRFGYHARGKEIRAAMEASGKVILSVSGHVHKNRVREINGIPYVTQQAWSNRYKKKYRVLSRTWSMMEADDNEIRISLHGKTKNSYSFSAKLPKP